MLTSVQVNIGENRLEALRSTAELLHQANIESADPNNVLSMGVLP